MRILHISQGAFLSMKQSQWRESSKRKKPKPRSSARKPTIGWTCFIWIPRNLVVLLYLSIKLLSVNEQLQRRTTSSVVTCTLRFKARIQKILFCLILQEGFSTTSCGRSVPLATTRTSPRASSMPWDTSSIISTSSMTLLGSNASDQYLLWKSLGGRQEDWG